MQDPDFIDIIHERVIPAGNGCLVWTGAKTKDGYATIRLRQGEPPRYVHRFVYELCIGPIPDGMEIDHECRRRDCVNPLHLQPRTHRDNVLRGNSPTALNARKTACLRGHVFSEQNTIRTKAGGRRCRACRTNPIGKDQDTHTPASDAPNMMA